MTLHPCPDDFFQDFVLMPFQSSSLSSLSDSSLSSLGGHRCIDVALALHCQCLLRCPDVLTEIYIFTRSYFQISINPNDMTLRCILQFVFKFTSTFPCNLFLCNLSSNPHQAFLAICFFAICLQIQIKPDITWPNTMIKELTWNNPESTVATHVTTQPCEFLLSWKHRLPKTYVQSIFAYLQILSPSYSIDI